MPEQVVFTKDWRRNLGFSKQFEDRKENEEFLAAVIRELTGDWYRDAPCNAIQNPRRKVIDEVIYFGPKEDVEVGGIAESFMQLSKMDRYNFNE